MIGSAPWRLYRFVLVVMGVDVAIWFLRGSYGVFWFMKAWLPFASGAQDASRGVCEVCEVRFCRP